MSRPMVYHDMSFDEYRRLPGWNWSVIKMLAKSPLHAYHAHTAPDEDSASRVMLRAIHCLVLEPHEFDGAFAIYEGKVRRGKEFDAFAAAHEGKGILNPREYAEAQATAGAYRAHPEVMKIAQGACCEVVVTWTDGETGLPCKARVDAIKEGAGIMDLKTIGTTIGRRVAALTATNLYHGQLAHYAEGCEANGIKVPAAYIAAAESKPPQDVALFALDDGAPDGALYVGRSLRRRLMRRLAECVERDEWPGRHPETQNLCLPSYAIDDELEFGGEDLALAEMP